MDIYYQTFFKLRGKNCAFILLSGFENATGVFGYKKPY